MERLRKMQVLLLMYQQSYYSSREHKTKEEAETPNKFNEAVQGSLYELPALPSLEKEKGQT